LLDKAKVEEQKTMWQFINIALPVLLVILAGFFFSGNESENIICGGWQRG
jgi:hypothetical protein